MLDRSAGGHLRTVSYQSQAFRHHALYPHNAEPYSPLSPRRVHDFLRAARAGAKGGDVLSLELAQVRARVAALALQVGEHTELVHLHTWGDIHPRVPTRRPPPSANAQRDTWNATHTIYTTRHPRDQAKLSAASDACALGACSAAQSGACVRACARVRETIRQQEYEYRGVSKAAAGKAHRSATQPATIASVSSLSALTLSARAPAGWARSASRHTLLFICSAPEWVQQ